jgi:hypothetical protein
LIEISNLDPFFNQPLREENQSAHLHPFENDVATSFVLASAPFAD